MNLQTGGPDIYRALLESLCFGARSIIDHLAAGGAPIERIILTSGLSQNNVLLMQLMADILGRDIKVPLIPHVTAVSAAIHGAVAAGVVADYTEGARSLECKRASALQSASGSYHALSGALQRILQAQPEFSCADCHARAQQCGAGPR
jgi:L-ribulokinase